MRIRWFFSAIVNAFLNPSFLYKGNWLSSFLCYLLNGQSIKSGMGRVGLGMRYRDSLVRLKSLLHRHDEVRRPHLTYVNFLPVTRRFYDRSRLW